MTKAISILGSTGSIGVSTLDIVAQHPDRFKVVGLAAGSNLDVLTDQIEKFQPQLVSVKDEATAKDLQQRLSDSSLTILTGSEGAQRVAAMSEADMVVSAIVGAAGLLPTLKALSQGKTVGLANKESMVIAGELMNQVARDNNATILPIDSEHSALFQCLHGHRLDDVHQLILTASGGPFLHKPKQEFETITVEQALKHPNWDMGAKITIDSATMMNKGLEVMEARWLFNLPVSQIDVCVHPQSIVHSMVEYRDGSVMAHLGVPDMKVPIAYALSYPERVTTGTERLNLAKLKELTFFKPDFDKFVCLKTAFEVAEAGKTYPAVLNAANEVAVAAFLDKQISFNQIHATVKRTLDAHKPDELKDLDAVLAADSWARRLTEERLHS